MKKLGMTLVTVIVAALLLTSTVFAAVTNGTFETGDFTGWAKSTFINNGFSVAQGAGGNDLSAIVGNGSAAPLSIQDDHTPLLYPRSGHYSARVNSDKSYQGGGNPQNGNTLKQTLSADLDSIDGLAHIRFSYAAVMVEPNGSNHTSDQVPYFRVRVINTSNSNDIIYDFSSYVGQANITWSNGDAFGTSGTWKYVDWQDIDLVSSQAHPVAQGDNILVEITAAGCQPTGHPGYVYVDDITNLVSVVPTGTATATEVPATSTATATATDVPATSTATATATDVPPTSTATATLVPPTSTSTATDVPPTGTSTATAVPATATRTATVTNTPNVSPFAVTINQAAGQVDPTTTRLLSFTAVFAEAVTGFTAADVDVVLTASTTCAPTVTVTGSGTTYNVALTLMRNECTATVTIPAGGANSIARPGAVNSASTSTDNAQTFHYIKKYYFSQAVNDGWILESGAATSVGGTMSNVGDTMSVGDDASNRELRIFSRFDTTADPVPTTATIAVVNYRIKQVPGSSLGNVFTARGNLISELNKPYFGTTSALELGDFQAAADSGACNFDTTILADGFYRCVFFQVSINLFPKGGGFINMRSRFATQDTNNTADQLTVYTGDYSYQYSKPQLFVAYFFEPVAAK